MEDLFTVPLHNLKVLDNDLRTRPNKDLTLSGFLSIIERFQCIRQNTHSNHGCLHEDLKRRIDQKDLVVKIWSNLGVDKGKYTKDPRSLIGQFLEKLTSM